MADLEQSLRSLAAAVEWPRAPELALPADLGRGRPRAPRLLLAAALALLVALGVAMAVPGARSAILRLLHVGGVTVERVDTLPPVPPRSLRSALGKPVSRAEAEAALGAPVRLPERSGAVQLYLNGTVVSALLVSDGRTVLLMELPSVPAGLLVKKLVSGATRILPLTVAGREGFWIEGPHALFEPGLPKRLAGDALLWDSGGTTYRLEGPGLRREAALRLARQMTG